MGQNSLVLKTSFDCQKFISKMGYDSGLISEAALSFSKYANSILTDMDEAILKKDRIKLKKLLNSFKFSLAYLYASKGMEIVVTLEKAAENENLHTSDEIYLSLKDEIKQIKNTFKKTLVMTQQMYSCK